MSWSKYIQIDGMHLKFKQRWFCCFVIVDLLFSIREVQQRLLLFDVSLCLELGGPTLEELGILQPTTASFHFYIQNYWLNIFQVTNTKFIVKY